jgi:hypothetical protein
MKRIQILLLILSFIAFSACGTSNSVSKKTTSKTEVEKDGLPPNVASNKYSKKRRKN